MAKNAKAKPAGDRRKGGKAARSSPLRRVLRGLGWVLVALVMAPIVLVPLYTVVPPVSTLMAWRTLSGGNVERDWVALDAIAPVLTASVMMSEDGRFCAHDGVDWTELNKVLESDNGRPRGASTISMQTVKNVFLWPSRSVVRKALEIPLAMFADTVWGKRRTMEIYLNIVEWAPGVFGAEAAARHHFGRSASRLTASQAALMAVTLPNPYVRDPARPSARLQSLARTAAVRARASGGYTDCLSPPGPL